MKVLAWNLLYGALLHGNNSNAGYHVNQSAEAAARRVIADADADIVILNEALYCRPYNSRHRQYGGIFGYPHEACALHDQHWGNAILSRWPVDTPVVLPTPDRGAETRSALFTMARTPAGPLNVGTNHPHPWTEPRLRAGDFAELLLAMNRHAGPSLVAGDFNAIDPEDNTDRQALLREFEGFSPPGKADSGMQRFLDADLLLFREVMPSLGWHRAEQEDPRTPTIPTAKIRSAISVGMRIDHAIARSLRVSTRTIVSGLSN